MFVYGARIEIDEYDVDAHVRLNSRLPDYTIESAPMAPHVQAALAALVVLCRTLVDRHLSPQRVLLVQWVSPASADRLRAFFECPVLLGAPEDALVFGAASLDTLLDTANPLLLNINEQAVVPYHARLDARHVGDRVRAQIARLLPSGEVSQRAVALSLNLSLRSMQRKLKEEGASFRGLVDETRAGGWRVNTRPIRRFRPGGLFARLCRCQQLLARLAPMGSTPGQSPRLPA